MQEIRVRESVPALFTLLGAFVSYLFVDYLFWACVIVCVLHIVWINVKEVHIARKIHPRGKYVLITGCDGGLGKKFALRANKLGFTVFACCHDDDSEGARELERYEDVKIHVLKLDVTVEDDVMAAVKHVSKYCEIDGLWAVVNAIDVAGGGPIELCAVDHYLQVLDVNLLGVLRITKAFLHLIRLAKGRVINLSSECGLVARGRSSSYCMSKYGIEAFSDSLASEMAPFEVQVSLLEVEEIPSHVQVQKMGRRLFEEFYSASEDVQKSYPWDDVEKLVKSKYEAIRHSKLSVSEVLDTLQCQLTHASIDPRYLVMGWTRKPADFRLRILLTLKKYVSNVSNLF